MTDTNWKVERFNVAKTIVVTEPSGVTHELMKDDIVHPRAERLFDRLIEALNEKRVAAPAVPQSRLLGYINAGHLHEMQSGRVPYVYVYASPGVGAEVPVYTTPSQEPEPFDEREAFEREMRSRHGWNNSYFTQSNDGGYLSNRATYAYIGWQARAAIEKSAAKEPGQKWWETKCKNCEGTGYNDPGVADNPDGDGRPPVVCNQCGGNGCGKEKP